MKYKNLKQLKKAYDSGELSKKNPLTLDNDISFVYVGEKKVFENDEPPEASLLSEALTLLGIPHEGV